MPVEGVSTTHDQKKRAKKGAKRKRILSYLVVDVVEHILLERI